MRTSEAQDIRRPRAASGPTARPWWWTAALYAASAALAVWTLLPLYWLLRLSLTTHITLLDVPVALLPNPPTLANFGWVFDPAVGEAAMIRRGFLNSLLVAGLATLLVLAVATPAAYAISRWRPRGASTMHFLVLLGRAYPPISLALPLFWFYARVDLLGTVPGLVLAYVALLTPLVIWLLVGVFAALPPALLAASRVDGNTPWQTFRHVALPLAGPGIAGGAVVAFLGCWNEFTLAQFLVAGSGAQTFPMVVAPLLSGAPNQVAAASVLGLLPAVLLALLFRRWLGQLSPVARVR